jgi:membrane-bound lytic murein transglycosylase B
MVFNRSVSKTLVAGLASFILTGCANATEAEPAAGPGAQQEAAAPAVSIDRTSFDRWLQDAVRDAAANGISQTTIDRTLGKVEPVPRVIELDRFQPEYTQTFWTYMDRATNAKRVEQGRELLRRHAPLLAEIERKYGVQPRFLVAFWGLETNFGATFGGFPVIGSLATLAFDERRAAFFRRELMTPCALWMTVILLPNV